MSYFKIKEGDLCKEANWNERTCERRQGGYSLNTDSLIEGTTVLPKGAVIALDSEGTAILVKTAKTTAAATKSATSINLEKGHGFVVGDKVNGATISAIDTTAADYDTLTISALGAAVANGAVVASDFGTGIVGLNYASVVIDENPSVTVTLQAYDIDESTMPYPVNDAIKEALTSRHSFL